MKQGTRYFNNEDFSKKKNTHTHQNCFTFNKLIKKKLIISDIFRLPDRKRQLS